MSNWTSPREGLPAHCARCDWTYNPATGPCPRCTLPAPAQRIRFRTHTPIHRNAA